MSASFSYSELEVAELVAIGLKVSFDATGSQWFRMVISGNSMRSLSHSGINNFTIRIPIFRMQGRTKPTCPNRLRSSSSSSSRFAGQGRKDRESEGEAVKLEVKTRCAEASRFLSRANLSNSTRISEKKGLLVLARHVENERGQLQLHCLF
ncbi:hypothetical protein Syun_001040 [Stephania yunnanensis]|uniref:Uncharacterized protein n=1 Tax=Stephania yunnanensis TaxID=152371 RepID=A0AAP0LFW1_9MAGN